MDKLTELELENTLIKAELKELRYLVKQQNLTLKSLTILIRESRGVMAPLLEVARQYRDHLKECD